MMASENGGASSVNSHTTYTSGLPAARTPAASTRVYEAMMQALVSAQASETRESCQRNPAKPSDSTPPQISSTPIQTVVLGASPSQASAHTLTMSGATPRMIG